MKFSIRDLLLVTVIVALAAGWWVDHWNLAEVRDELYFQRLKQSLPLKQSRGPHVILNRSNPPQP